MSAPTEKMAPAVKPAPPRRNLLLGAVVAINMLGMIALGTYLALLGRASAAAEAPASAPAEPEEPEEVGPLVELESMIVNLAEERGDRYLKVTLQFELRGPDDAEPVEARLVPVRDAVLSHLSTLHIADVHGEGRMAAVRDHLLTIVNERLGEARVRRLYFTEYLVQ